MARFWDARAKEDAFFFVDDRQAYKATDEAAFWEQGETLLDKVLEMLELHLRPEDAVVDIGCGVGRLTRALATRVAHVHAIDVSEAMLHRARELNSQLDNVTWHHGDGTSLRPIADDSVGAIVSHVVFQHIPEPEITYGYVREMGRVLQPGGWAAFQVSNDPAVHSGRHTPPSRLKVLLGRAPRGQRDPEWLGSAVDLDCLADAAADGGLNVQRVVGAGTQFCFVRLG